EATPTLGVLHRFEQEGRRVVLVRTGELHERGDGRLQVGQDLTPDGHDRVVARERAELVARQTGSAHRAFILPPSHGPGGGTAAEGSEEAAALAGVARPATLLL